MYQLFPRDKSIFLICGGGGYSFFTKTLLTFLGWDASKIYVIGADWSYNGQNGVTLTYTPDKGTGAPPMIATWLADYKYINFSLLTPLREGEDVYRTVEGIHIDEKCYCGEPQGQGQ